MKQAPALEAMDWEERFMAAWAALCAMEARAERAEAMLIQHGLPLSEWVIRDQKVHGPRRRKLFHGE